MYIIAPDWIGIRCMNRLQSQNAVTRFSMFKPRRHPNLSFMANTVPARIRVMKLARITGHDSMRAP